MSEQAEQKQVKPNSNAFKLEESAQDMIARVMSIARLLTTEGAALDDLPAAQRHASRKKHKNENL
jgi:hypothetical protein